MGDFNERSTKQKKNTEKTNKEETRITNKKKEQRKKNRSNSIFSDTKVDLPDVMSGDWYFHTRSCCIYIYISLIILVIDWESVKGIVAIRYPFLEFIYRGMYEYGFVECIENTLYDFDALLRPLYSRIKSKTGRGR